MPLTQLDVAIHEAGHAVVGHEYRKPVTVVSIIPEGIRLGRASISNQFDWADIDEGDGTDPKIRRKIELRKRRRIAILVAGDVANNRWRPATLPLVSERVPVNYFDRIMELEPVERGETGEGVRDAAILEQSDVHFALQLVLELPGEMIGEIRRAEETATRILRRRWNRVRHLADKLVKRGEVTGQELYSSLERR